MSETSSGVARAAGGAAAGGALSKTLSKESVAPGAPSSAMRGTFAPIASTAAAAAAADTGSYTRVRASASAST